MAPGENALWWGRPRQGLFLRGSDLFTVPFSLLWCGFALFWEHGVASAPNAPVFMVIWGLPFVAVGVYLVIGRFFGEAWQRSKTWYALTPERVLIVSGVFSRSVQSLSLKTLSEMTFTDHGGGRGSITFGPQGPAAAWFGGGSSWPGARRQQAPCFDQIDDAKAVHERLRSAQRAVA